MRTWRRFRKIKSGIVLFIEAQYENNGHFRTGIISDLCGSRKRFREKPMFFSRKIRRIPISRYANAPTPLAKRRCFANGVSRNYSWNAWKTGRERAKNRNSCAPGGMGKTTARCANEELCRNYDAFSATLKPQFSCYGCKAPPGTCTKRSREESELP